MTRPKKTAASAAPKPRRAASARPAPKRAAAAAPKKPAAQPQQQRKAPKPAPRVSHGAEPAVVAQIRELEAQLDRLIDQASHRDLSALAP